MKDFTRVCRIEPQAVGAWLKQTSVKSNFQHVVYMILFFPTTTKKNANIRHPFKLQILFDRAADKTYIGGHGYYNCVQLFHCAQARRYLIG
jgi:hypothetical protein